MPRDRARSNQVEFLPCGCFNSEFLRYLCIKDTTVTNREGNHTEETEACDQITSSLVFILCLKSLTS